MSKPLIAAYPDNKGGVVIPQIGDYNGDGKSTSIGDYITNTAVSAGRELLNGLIESTKNWLPKAISSAQAAVAQLSYSGSTGNFLSTEETIVLTGKFFKMVDQYPEKIGSPLYEAVNINTLSGFCKCKDAVFSSAVATTVEETAIEAFMNNGFYYE